MQVGGKPPPSCLCFPFPFNTTWPLALGLGHHPPWDQPLALALSPGSAASLPSPFNPLALIHLRPLGRYMPAVPRP